MAVTKKKVREFLLAYAWNADHTDEQKAAEVECILAQGDWKYVEDRADRRAGASETGGGKKEFADAVDMELSALYECHDEPHIKTCPNATPDVKLQNFLASQRRKDEER